MIELDLATVITLHVSGLLAGCGAFFHLRQLGVKPGALEWLGLGYGAQALGAFCAGMGEQHRLPDGFWQGASLWLGVTGYSFTWAGLCRLSRGHRRRGDGWIALLVPLACLLLVGASGTLASNEARATFFLVPGFFFLAATAADISGRAAKDPLRARKLLAAVLALFCVSQVACLALILSRVSRPDWLAAVFLVQILCYFALALFVSALLTERLARELRDLAEHDPLTGLGNRARLDHLLGTTPATGMAAIMVDIDHFKRINDRHGHVAGDKVLTSVAALLKSGLRERDMCIRYGGEEFLIVVRATDAPHLAERLRARIAEHAIAIGTDHKVRVTASFGVAFQEADGRSWAALIQEADSALYIAKTGGRNRIVFSEQDSGGGGGFLGGQGAPP